MKDKKISNISFQHKYGSSLIEKRVGTEFIKILKEGETLADNFFTCVHCGIKKLNSQMACVNDEPDNLCQECFSGIEN